MDVSSAKALSSFEALEESCCAHEIIHLATVNTVFGVVKAAWTPEFWRTSVLAFAHSSYSRKTGAIRTLDDYLNGAGISDPDFRLRPPNRVDTVIWEGNEVSASVHLDSLAKSSPPVG
jgi:hypothetical protein